VNSDFGEAGTQPIYWWGITPRVKNRPSPTRFAGPPSLGAGQAPPPTGTGMRVSRHAPHTPALAVFDLQVCHPVPCRLARLQPPRKPRPLVGVSCLRAPPCVCPCRPLCTYLRPRVPCVLVLPHPALAYQHMARAPHDPNRLDVVHRTTPQAASRLAFRLSTPRFLCGAQHPTLDTAFSPW